MDRKKYEFTGETRELSPTTILHRIRAVIDIPSAGVNAGDIGGWIESDSNLSHRGNAWVFDDARVFCNARVCDNAVIADNAWIWGNAYVSGDTRVYDHACVYDDAWVSNGSVIRDKTLIYNNARICGKMVVSGETRIGGNAYIKSSKDFITIGPIGSRSDFVTFYKNESEDIYVECGCFSGTMDEFLAAVQKTHGNNRFGREYRVAMKLAKVHILGEDNHD